MLSDKEANWQLILSCEYELNDISSKNRVLKVNDKENAMLGMPVALRFVTEVRKN